MGWSGSVLMEISDGLTEISVDGDRCWWSACNGLTEKRKEKDSKKKKGEEREAEIEIRMVWRRGYSEEKEGCWWSACDGLTKKMKEKDSPKKKKKRWRRERGGDREEIEIRIVWRRRRRGYSEKKEGLGGDRWEIIKKMRENIILIKKMYNRQLMWVFCKNDSIK